MTWQSIKNDISLSCFIISVVSSMMCGFPRKISSLGHIECSVIYDPCLSGLSLHLQKLFSWCAGWFDAHFTTIPLIYIYHCILIPNYHPFDIPPFILHMIITVRNSSIYVSLLTSSIYSSNAHRLSNSEENEIKFLKR
jgi:hypothetical protein